MSYIFVLKVRNSKNSPVKIGLNRYHFSKLVRYEYHICLYFQCSISNNSTKIDMLNVKNFAQERSQVSLLKAGNRFMKKKKKKKTNKYRNKQINTKQKSQECSMEYSHNYACFFQKVTKSTHSRPLSYATFFKVTSRVALVTAKKFFLGGIGRFKLYAH